MFGNEHEHDVCTQMIIQPPDRTLWSGGVLLRFEMNMKMMFAHRRLYKPKHGCTSRTIVSSASSEGVAVLLAPDNDDNDQIMFR